MKRTLILFCVAWGCALAANAQTTVNYSESQEYIVNPDIGFYRTATVSNSDMWVLDAAELQSWRNGLQNPGAAANYTVKSSMLYLNFELDGLQNQPTIPANFIANMQTNLGICRQAGVRVVLRYSYTNDLGDGVPPHGDASKSVVLAHIAQLKQVMMQNSDVIAVVQLGFIGVWGETYYSDYFGNVDANGYYTNTNWADRNQVIDSLLAATPATRFIQVRYPQEKQRAAYGVNAAVSSAALTNTEAYNGSKKARLAHYNDCFLSNNSDMGTFFDYGNNSTTTTTYKAALKTYLKNDTKYCPNGGETCVDGYVYNNCLNGAASLMDEYNISFLNAEYNNQVNNDWQTGGCMDSIKNRLGYRLVLTGGNFPTIGTAGSAYSFTLNLKNVGFTAPYNPRQLRLILRNTSNGTTTAVPISATNHDSRFWLPSSDAFSLNVSATLPVGLSDGSYELLLHLADTSNNNAIVNRPEYAIRFANNGLWEASTGYNKLNHTINIGNATATIPTPPTALAASQITSTSVKLTWADNANNETSYRVHQKLASASTFAQVATLSANANTHIVTGLQPGTTYQFRVRAHNSAGFSNYSNIVTVTTLPAITQFTTEAYPNPTNGEVALRIRDMATDLPCTIRVFDSRGVEVAHTVLPTTRDGELQTSFNLSTSPNGLYFIKVQCGERVQLTQVLLQK